MKQITLTEFTNEGSLLAAGDVIPNTTLVECSTILITTRIIRFIIVPVGVLLTFRVGPSESSFCSCISESNPSFTHVSENNYMKKNAFNIIEQS